MISINPSARTITPSVRPLAEAVSIHTLPMTTSTSRCNLTGRSLNSSGMMVSGGASSFTYPER